MEYTVPLFVQEQVDIYYIIILKLHPNVKMNWIHHITETDGHFNKYTALSHRFVTQQRNKIIYAHISGISKLILIICQNLLSNFRINKME